MVPRVWTLSILPLPVAKISDYDFTIIILEFEILTAIGMGRHVMNYVCILLLYIVYVTLLKKPF